MISHAASQSPLQFGEGCGFVTPLMSGTPKRRISTLVEQHFLFYDPFGQYTIILFNLGRFAAKIDLHAAFRGYHMIQFE